MTAHPAMRDFLLDVWTATRAHQIREYLRFRKDPWLKAYHRRAALDYAARVRSIKS